MDRALAPASPGVCYRDITENAWRAIPTHPHAEAVTLDDYVVMPDHVRGILVLNGVPGGADDGEAGGRCTLGEDSGEVGDGTSGAIAPTKSPSVFIWANP